MITEFIPLSDLCISITDCPHSTPKWSDEGYLVIRNYNIKDGKLDLSDVSYTDEETFNKRNRRAKPEAGDIIITREAPMGEVCIIPEGLECCMGQRMVLLKPDPTKINTKYLLYVLMSDFVQSHIRKSEGTGSIVSNLDISDLVSLPIPNLPMPLQEKIGSQLFDIDKKIDINKKINIEIENLIRTIYDYWFIQYEFPNEEGNPYKSSDGKMVWNEELKREIPEGLNVCDLNDYVFLNTETFNPKSEPNLLVEHYSIPAFDNNKLPIFEYSDEIGSNKYKVNIDSILVSKLNPRFQRVWKPFCLTDRAICSTEFMVYDVKNKESISYCHSLFLSSHFQSYLVSKETGSTGSRKRVEPEISLKYKVVEFPSSIIQKYGFIVEPYFKMIMKNLLENEELINYRNWLLPMLITGQISFSQYDLA